MKKEVKTTGSLLIKHEQMSEAAIHAEEEIRRPRNERRSALH